MRAKEIVAYFRQFTTKLEKSVDRVIIGDPDREVRAIAVCFMPFREAIEKAIAAGANVMVVHEPTFYAHLDLDDPEVVDMPATKEKVDFIERSDSAFGNFLEGPFFELDRFGIEHVVDVNVFDSDVDLARLDLSRLTAAASVDGPKNPQL